MALKSLGWDQGYQQSLLMCAAHMSSSLYIIIILLNAWIELTVVQS